MENVKYFLLLTLSMTLNACVTATKQTDDLLRDKKQIPVEYQIANVPFINQSAGYCGPATLAMAMNWAGRHITVEELAPLVYTPKIMGSFQTDLISASRRQGRMAIPIEGFQALLNEVAAGHPVIIFENLALSWFPRWHYAIVFGYNLNSETVTMHSGSEAFKEWDMRKFERSWKLGQYWALVVLPPSELSATASELVHLTAAVGIEQAGQIEQAATAYQAILKKWPQSLGGLIAMGNISFQKKQYSTAVKYYKSATKNHPASISAWHNLSIAEKHIASNFFVAPNNSRQDYSK